MRKTAAVSGLIILVLSSLIAVPVNAATKSGNNLSVKQKIVYVALTPAAEPDFWTADPVDSVTTNSDGAQLNFVKMAVSNAMEFWTRASNGKMKFNPPTFFVGKAGTAIKHCASSADVKSAMKIAKMKSIPVGTHLVVANINDNCGYAGLGAFSGNTVNLAVLSSGTLTHELGHNFGYRHSSSLYCKNSDYAKFDSKNCSVDEYGDFRDLMGNDDWCPKATLSATQRAITFGTPAAKDIKLGSIITVDESRSKSENIVYQLKYKGVWYFFEYSNPQRELCTYLGGMSYTPEIQVRVLGPNWTFAKGDSVGPMIIGRYEKELAAPVIPQEKDGMIMLPPSGGWILRGFKAGEKFQLPGAPFTLGVFTTDTGTATFSVTKSG